MPRAGLSCPGCGSSNIEQDDLYSQTQLVCVDCGSLVAEGSLTHDPRGGSDVSYRQTTSAAKRPCANLKKGLERVMAICRILRVTKEIEDLSQTYYTQAYQHRSFLRVHLEKKELLAACSVLISCRLHDWPITMTTISCLLDADPAAVGGVFKEMVSILNISVPVLSITDIIEAHSQEYKISSQHVPEELAEDYKALTKRAVDLVELAADAWIVSGRKYIPIMMAAIYLAWQSLKPNKQRLKFTLDKFCQIAQVNKQRPALIRIIEMKEVLCKLGKEIPWATEAVNPRNVVQQIDDIIKHRHALLRRAMRTQTALLEEQDSCEDSVTEETAPERTPSVQQCEQNTERANVLADEDNPWTVSELHSNTEENQDAPNWGKRLLFAPPSVIHAKIRRVEQPELKDVTGYEEISDSEIDSYIRTPREAREFALAQKTLHSSENKKS